MTETGVNVGRGSPLQSVRGLVVHLLVVDVGVWRKRLVCRCRAGRKGLSMEFRDCIIADELAGLVLNGVSWD